MLKKLMGATGIGVVFAATASLGAYAQVAPPVIEPVVDDTTCVTITQEKVDESGNIILDEFNDPEESVSLRLRLHRGGT